MCDKAFSTIVNYTISHTTGIACPHCGHIWDIIPQDPPPARTKREIACHRGFCKQFSLESWNNAEPNYLRRLLKDYRADS